MIQIDEKITAQATLAGLYQHASAVYKNRPAFALFSDGKITKQVTYERMGKYSKKAAVVLKSSGVCGGDRVLLLAENCPEWPIVYFGIAIAGAVSVPLLTGFSVPQIRYIAEHCGAKAICISKEMAQKFKSIIELPFFAKTPFIYIDTLISDESISVSVNGIKKKYTNIDIDNIENPRNSPDDLASIIYTSGTQGSSKGVMLSSRNLISSAVSTFTFIKVNSSDRVLSVLPLAHSYECSLGLIIPVICGSSITYLDKPPSPSVLLPAMKLIRPTIMASVPLLMEKIYNNSIRPKLRANPLYKFILTRPLVIFAAGRRLNKALGGRIRFFGIGGAPLCAEVEKFLYRIKFPYSIGYGLTEAAPLVAGNPPYRLSSKEGLVAPKTVEIRISDEGEIQVKGPNIMMGYYNDKEKTAQSFTSDCWLKTGDLGSIDKKGKLHIKGRLKALILGPSGENIYPEEIERLLGSSQLVEESLVYSGKKGELVAMVILSEAAKTAADVIENTMEELRMWVNKKLAAFSKLNRIEIKYEPFEKTPTMKIKRYLYI